MKILDKLNPRERKTVSYSVAIGALILGYIFLVDPVVQGGQQLRSQLRRERQKLHTLLAKEGTAEALKQKNLMAMVPAMEMPVSAEKQNQLLRDQITRQLQQAGVQVKNFSFSSGTAQGPGASGIMTLQCRGKCQFSALWRFFDELKKNPYYVGIEELSIKVDEKNRQDLEIVFTVSTFQGSGA
jgi:type II secretory pathway component PulM